MMGMSEGGYVTADGRSRLVIARPKRPPFDAEFSRALDARLRQLTASTARLAAQARENGDEEPRPAMQVQFAGGHRIAVETEALVKRESIWNTAGALIAHSAAAVPGVPQPLARHRRLRCLPACRWSFVLGAIGFTGAKLSAAATGAAAMLFGLGVDGVVLLYVAHRLALADGRSRRRSRRARRAVDQHAARHVDDRRHLLRADVRGLPEPRAARPAARPQHDGVRRPHARDGAGAAAAAASTPSRAGAADAAPGGVDRQPAPRACSRRASWSRSVLGFAATRMHVNPTLDRLRSVTDAAQIETSIGPQFGLPGDVYIVLAEGPELEPLLQSNERLTERLAADIPDLAFQPPTRLLPSAAAQEQRAATIRTSRLSPDGVRATLERARMASDFTPGAFEPFSERLPSLLDTNERITYDGLRRARPRRSGRSVRRPRIRPLVARDVSVSIERRPGGAHPGHRRLDRPVPDPHRPHARQP